MSISRTFNKIPLTEFSQEEIKNAFESFDRRMKEYNKFQIRNKTIYVNLHNDDDDDENQEENTSFVPKKNENKFILIDDLDTYAEAKLDIPQIISETKPVMSMKKSASKFLKEFSHKFIKQYFYQQAQEKQVDNMPGKMYHKQYQHVKYLLNLFYFLKFKYYKQKENSQVLVNQQLVLKYNYHKNIQYQFKQNVLIVDEEEVINKRQFVDTNSYNNKICARKSAI